MPSSRQAWLYSSPPARWATTSCTDQPAHADGRLQLGRRRARRRSGRSGRLGVHQVVGIEAVEHGVVGHARTLPHRRPPAEQLERSHGRPGRSARRHGARAARGAWHHRRPGAGRVRVGARDRFVTAPDRPPPTRITRCPSAPGQTISQPYIVALMVEALDAAADRPRARGGRRLGLRRRHPVAPRRRRRGGGADAGAGGGGRRAAGRTGLRQRPGRGGRRLDRRRRRRAVRRHLRLGQRPAGATGARGSSWPPAAASSCRSGRRTSRSSFASGRDANRPRRARSASARCGSCPSSASRAGRR